MSNEHIKGLLDNHEKSVINSCFIPEEWNEKLKHIAKELETTKEHLTSTIMIDFAKNWERNKQKTLKDQIKERNKIFAKEKLTSKVIPEIN